MKHSVPAILVVMAAACPAVMWLLWLGERESPAPCEYSEGSG